MLNDLYLQNQLCPLSSMLKDILPLLLKVVFFGEVIFVLVRVYKKL